jgi:hypothetical protein
MGVDVRMAFCYASKPGAQVIDRLSSPVEKGASDLLK